MASRTSRNASNDTGHVERALETPLGEELRYLLSITHSRTSQFIQEALDEFDLTIRQQSILAFISDQSSSSQHNLAKMLEIDPSQVVALVNSLESRGLLRRQVDPNDRRTNAVVMTDEGKNYYDKVHEATKTAEARAASTLSNRDQKNLKELLRRIAI